MYRFIKRALDIVISLFAIILLAPVFLVTSLCVALTSYGPVIFRQRRIGRDCREFTIYKFRTMYVNAPHETPTHKLRHAGRHITPVGRFLRASSLDELPQLVNILKGDMSLVGPRPALYNQSDLIMAREEKGVNSLRPGLTSWAQINGRDELPIPVKAAYDAEYARRMSFMFDLRCVVGTVLCVTRGSGVREGAEKDA